MTATERDEILTKYLTSFKATAARVRRHTLAWSALPLCIGLAVLGLSYRQLAISGARLKVIERSIQVLEQTKRQYQQDMQESIATKLQLDMAISERQQALAESNQELISLQGQLTEVRSKLDKGNGSITAKTISDIRQIVTPNPAAALASAPGSAKTPTARGLWNQGYKVYLEGKRDEAKRLYEQAKQIDPNYAPALNSLGRIAGEEGDSEAEARLYGEALQKDGKYVPALNNLAIVEYGRGNLEKAEALTKQALALRPGYLPSVALLREIQANRSHPGASK